MDNLKILFVSYKLCDGGAERVLSKLANALSGRGIDVSVLLYQRFENEYILNDSVRVLELGEDAHKGRNGVSRMINRVKAIRRIIKRERPNFVIPFLDSMVRESQLAARGLSCKVIATVRNSPYQVPETKGGRLLRNWFCRRCAAVFVQNEAQKAYFSKRIRKKTFVVANPLDDELLFSEKQYSERIHEFITCGRLHPQKNHKLLIDAFAIATKKHPHLRLSIYGVGDEQENLERYIQEKDLGENIRLMGRTDDVRSVLLQSDCFLLSSSFEGMPNALMEAMAVGLPCISTDCPTGPADLIKHGETGFLVEVGDVEGLAEHIVKTVENPKAGIAMGKAAQKKMRALYSQEKIAGALLDNLQKYVVKK